MSPWLRKGVDPTPLRSHGDIVYAHGHAHAQETALVIAPSARIRVDRREGKAVESYVTAL